MCHPEKKNRLERRRFTIGYGRCRDGKDTGIINLNTATKAELLSLSGIGESRAEAIIAYRETNGGFRKIEDLKKWTGSRKESFRRSGSR